LFRFKEVPMARITRAAPHLSVEELYNLNGSHGRR